MIHPQRGVRFTVWGLLAPLVFFLCCAKGQTPATGRHPLVVIGLDGADWKPIERLWQEGKLPHLKSLADRGAKATLRTAYSYSPLIWTTIATGMTPEVHGINDFVSEGPAGETPVSSELREVPALWNMASTTNRRVLTMGWWASWPAEPVNGVTISDRAFADVPSRVYPESRLATVIENLATAEAAQVSLRNLLPGPAARMDRLVAQMAPQIVSEGYDLSLIYLRSIDAVQHMFWKHFEPEKYNWQDATEKPTGGGKVTAVYEAMDEIVGSIIQAAPGSSNFIVLSDHGVKAVNERVTVHLDVDAILEQLGYLQRQDGQIQWDRTTAYTVANRTDPSRKVVRLALEGTPQGTVDPTKAPELLRRLTADLRTARYAGGKPVFTVRLSKVTPNDLALRVNTDEPSRELWVKEKLVPQAVTSFRTVSGSHSADTHGIFLAAGPDIDPKADLDGINIHSIAPTLLYGMGLPAGEDFVEAPMTELYTASFRKANPVQTIATWGTREAGAITDSAADEEIIQELKALGYLGN